MTRFVWLTIFETIGCMAVGWLAAYYVVRWTKRGQRGRQKYVNGDALSFVGGALGIALRLLLLFASQHYSDAREASREEATSATALYDSLQGFPEAQRAAARHDVFCAVESLRTDDWVASQVNDVTGSENTHAWMDRLRDDIDGLDQSTDAAGSLHYFVNDSYISLSKAREIRLLLGLHQIPNIVWVVIAISTTVFTFLLALHMGPRRRKTIAVLIATGLVMCTINVALTVLDYPYKGAVGQLNPTAMDAASRALQDRYVNDDFSACPQLVTPVYESWD